MKLNYFVVLLIIIAVLSACSTLQKQKEEEKSKWDYDQYLLETFKLTNQGKYQKAIDLLNEMAVKFPNDNLVAINYNIAYVLYKLKKYDDSIGYCNTVINMDETGNYSEAMRAENKKFVVLSTILIEKIKTFKEDLKDPYHIKEEQDANKKLKPQKDDKSGN